MCRMFVLSIPQAKMSLSEEFAQNILGPRGVQRVACTQGCGGAVHDIGHAYSVQHGYVILIVTKGHDLGRGNAQHAAEGLHTDALVG